MTDSPGLDVTFTVSGEEDPVDLDRVRSFLQWASSRIDLRGELGIWLCTDDEIADLHVRYISVDGPTDVITFPASDPPDSEGYAGDIAVSVDTAARQAADVGHTTEREIAFLCLHGLLHLAGLDDQDDESRRTMLERQEELIVEFERICPGDWI